MLFLLEQELLEEEIFILKEEKKPKKNIHIGIDWLTSIAFEHTKSIGKKVVVLGGGNTAMDCCRSSLGFGAEDVKV